MRSRDHSCGNWSMRTLLPRLEDEIRALDYEDLNARAGSHKWGYVEPSEAAWEILEETVEPPSMI